LRAGDADAGSGGGTGAAVASTRRGVTVRAADTLLRGLAGVARGRSYGMPAYLLGGKFFARFRDDDTVLVVQLGRIEDRDVLMQLQPRAFFFTDHYRDYPAVLVRLAEVPRALLREVLVTAHRELAERRRVSGRTRAARAPRRRRT
jgi:hypothetical protein